MVTSVFPTFINIYVFRFEFPAHVFYQLAQGGLCGLTGYSVLHHRIYKTFTPGGRSLLYQPDDNLDKHGEDKYQKSQTQEITVVAGFFSENGVT